MIFASILSELENHYD